MRIAERARNLLTIYRAEGLRRTVTRYAGRLVYLTWTSKPLWTPRRLTVPLDSIEIDRPVFLLGTQGAGLTLLRRMIQRHPCVVAVGAGPSFWAGYDEMDKDPLGRGRLPEALSLRAPGHRNMTGRERAHPIFGLERSWVYATDALLPEYRKTAEDATPELCRALRRRIAASVRAYARDPRRCRFLDKSQTFTLKVPLLEACFPEARFVLQLRNPYAMCWRVATARYENEVRLWTKKPSLEERLVLAAQHWRNTYLTAWEDLRERGNAIVTRFEHLIASPEQELRRVLEAIDLSFDPDLLPQASHTIPFGSPSPEKWYPIRSDVNDRYLRNMPRAARDLVRHELGELPDELTYPAPVS